MLIPDISSEHARRLYNLDCRSHLGHVKSIATVTKRIIISKYNYNKICDEHTVDMLLPLNTIDKFLITRFIDIKRVHYKDT
jgi:hypothetical protein